MFQTPQKHLEKTFFQVILSRAWARELRAQAGPGRPWAQRGASVGPSQHMNFNFFLKNQFWSYEHAKTFVVTGNMSI